MVQIFKPSKRSKAASSKQPLLLQVDDLNHQGEGVARDNGRVVFVDGALPNERVEARVTDSRKRFQTAKLIKVVEASAQRVTPFCSHFGDCGGCALQHLSAEGQRVVKQKRLARVLADHHVAEPEDWHAPISGETQGYRRRARISIWFGKGKNEFKVGFRQRSSKALVEIDSCPVLAESLQSSFKLLRQLLVRLKRPKVFSHLEVCQSQEGTVWILRQLDQLRNDDLTLVQQFAEQHSLQLLTESNSGALQTLTGEAAPIYHYQLTVAEQALDVGFAPNHFIQVNEQVNRAMVTQAVDWLAPRAGETIADLFSGVGNFSFAIASVGAKVIGVEGIEAMNQRAAANAERLALTDRCQFETIDLNGDLTEFAQNHGPFDGVLLDPARAGAQAVAEQIHLLAPHRLVYVSCDPATLARDTEILCSQGYRIEKAGIIDMFPHTTHLESMLLFRKDGKAKVRK
ncbi:23S rRNA (uracil(1939)-C(5))-methyltransferase RlmD [Corallincola luteus]|uniref:23S rRNA (uracil(1939)-C(5))-methyltransferase RlmD n=1 Tax=Corallincola luteus TaxID=1775177 RepID=A0ABY2AS27_9GAMM|nr:23S rRNA (uracil(1939)-C(5))-methyltransferase RlmD [Corallincola luteus]TCI05016.1 23S rRNA (uracil(1939)-C(5))-methyltransferase RlmD [Corallincola luteus]